LSIKCSAKEFAHNVKLVHLALANKSPLPILKSIKLDAEDGVLKITGTNLEHAAMATLKIRGEEGEKTSYAVSGELLSRICELLPGEEITLEPGENGETLVIQTDETKFNLVTFPVEDFPQIPTHKNALFCQDKEELIRHLDRVRLATERSKIYNKWYATCVHLLIEGQKVEWAATDGYRLAVQTAYYKAQENQRVEYLLEADSLKTLVRILRLSNSTDPIEVGYGQDHIFFNADGLSFISRIVVESYPDYNAVIPKSNTKGVYVKRENLLEALQLVDITTDLESGAVLLQAEGNTLRLSSSSGIGSAKQTISLLKPVEPIAITFRATHLIGALAQMRSTDIILWLQDPKTALILEPSPESENLDEGFVYVFMPIWTQA
jgi:DNA polymerase-3 subunit beta